MEDVSTRIFLTGRMAVEHDGARLDERALGSRQARLLWAFLVLERHGPATREQVAEILWPGDLPAQWSSGLNALASKLRQGLAGLAPAAFRLDAGHGWYHLAVPPRTWVDVEQAALSVDLASAALEAGDVGRAWGDALVAATIARQPFLGGVEHRWVDGRRAVLRTVLVRALEAFADACLATGQPALASSAAEEAATLEPFRESAYRRLMAAHVAAGNRAEALRVYERCRGLLARELGAHPSQQTRALHETLLRD